MTKHVDGKLLGEHIRNMGCDFVAGRAELAPQVVQTIGDEPEDEHSADCVDDTLIGLMTNSMCEQATTRGKPLRDGNRGVSCLWRVGDSSIGW